LEVLNATIELFLLFPTAFAADSMNWYAVDGSNPVARKERADPVYNRLHAL
jgi:hypothetical protein